MIISEVTMQDIKDYARIDYDDDDTNIELIMLAVKAYIRGYTGLSNESMDSKEDLTIAFMVLCNEMYSQRQYTVENDKVNRVVKSILDLYAVNLL